jgi:hypothetical protein
MVPINIDLENFLAASAEVRTLLRSAGGSLVHSRIEFTEELAAIEIEDPRVKKYVERLTQLPACTFHQAIAAGNDVPLGARACAELLHEFAKLGVVRFPR